MGEIHPRRQRLARNIFFPAKLAVVENYWHQALKLMQASHFQLFRGNHREENHRLKNLLIKGFNCADEDSQDFPSQFSFSSHFLDNMSRRHMTSKFLDKLSEESISMTRNTNSRASNSANSLTKRFRFHTSCHYAR